MREKALEFLKQTQKTLAGLDGLVDSVAALAEKIKASIEKGGKLIAFGNGGSAADAQHLVAEMVVRFEKDRRSLPAVALTTNTSTLTACANDYGFENVFSRQIESLADKKDVVLAISTSGVSPNVIKGAEEAKKKGAFVAGLTGRDGGKLKGLCDLCIIVKSRKTADIQVAHIALIHILCLVLENEFVK